ncbi:MAG: dipeptidase [Acidobacteriota bacterium]|nr:dipeptidase [Acidobacteriota bacterium]
MVFIYNQPATFTHFIGWSSVTLMRLSRLLIALLPLFSVLTFAQNASPTAAPPQSSTQKKSSSQALTISPNGAATGARAIHNSALIVDTHADTPGRFVDENFDLAQDAGTGHLDFNKIKAGNLGAEFFSIWVDPKTFKGWEIQRALDMIDSVYEQARLHPDKMQMAFSTQDILAAHRQHKLAALMGVEGGHAIQGDMRVLRDYYRLGVRYMTLTWSNTNELGDSSGDLTDKRVEHHNGITDFGRRVVREMNRLGIIVDISHVADRTYYQALVASRAPVIASHSSSRALTDAPRNMTDDMLIALARNGGVAQVNFNCGFISQKYRDREKQLEAEKDPDYEKVEGWFLLPQTAQGRKQIDADKAALEMKLPRPPLSDLIDHIDHMVKVAGIDHVGLGSDFDGVPCTPQGLDSAADLPKITQALYERGYKAADLDKILGGNLMRVFGEVEKLSKEIQAETNRDNRRELAPSGPPQQ